jgi:hypothetical protein
MNPTFFFFYAPGGSLFASICVFYLFKDKYEMIYETLAFLSNLSGKQCRRTCLDFFFFWFLNKKC